MFTAATFQLIRNNCQKELDTLLKKISIKVDWAGDKFRVYDRLDAELTKKICGLMKSPTIIDGYMSLLDLGGVAYDYSETDNKLLGKVVANKEKILHGLENLPKFVEEEVIVESQPIQQKAPPIQQKTKTVTNEEHVTLIGPIILGVFLIVAGLALAFNFDDGIVMDEETKWVVIGATLIIFGIFSAGLGVNGKTIRTTVTVPVKEKPVVPQPVAQPVKQKQIVRKEVKPPFTRNELQKTLDVLAQVDKIVRAI